MSKKDDCKKELVAIEKRQDKYGGNDWQPMSLCAECTLHRWVTTFLIDENGEILPQIVVDKRLSVLVSCKSCPFGDLNLRKAAEDEKERGLPIIGSVKLKASYFIGKTWHIKHDPFPYPRKEDEVPQNQNHLQIICDKEFDVER